ncbi:hypothetical protein J7382_03170 [Shimia sp. R11_0]|uniref:hypothetical protein n=1 Tax=Shimia sp. R11_0 TaxID=2821096 RepID=UPI001ADB74DC|nr:hypothetical protein [Shimia sp. R11_0]MBO9476527.1 hypothetical protein [Shimia sp. R11_0]
MSLLPEELRSFYREAFLGEMPPEGIVRHKRKQFRAEHHYFPALKYWTDYQAKFEYLDVKSQGLLAGASINTAVFAIFLTRRSPATDTTPLIDTFILLVAFLGFACVIYSAICSLRCFATTTGAPFRSFVKRIRKFEDAFIGVEGKKREAAIDWLLSSYTELIAAPFHLHPEIKECLKQEFDKLCQAAPLAGVKIKLSFDEIDKELRGIFDELRYRAEREVEIRHSRYASARVSLRFSILLLALLVFLVAEKHLNLTPL